MIRDRDEGALFETTWPIIDFVTTEDRDCGSSHSTIIRIHTRVSPFSRDRPVFHRFPPSRSTAAPHRATNSPPPPLPKTTAFAYVTGVRRRRREPRGNEHHAAPPTSSFQTQPTRQTRVRPTYTLASYAASKERDDDLDPRLNGHRQGVGDFPFLETLNPSYGYVGSGQVNK